MIRLEALPFSLWVAVELGRGRGCVVVCACLGGRCQNSGVDLTDSLVLCGAEWMLSPLHWQCL